MASEHHELFSDVYQHKIYPADNPPLLALIPPGVERILDVGCGSGGNARLLKERGYRVWGVTLSEDEAEAARVFCETVVVRNAESSDLGFSSDFFDVLLLSHVLEHMIRPEKALTRLASHVKVGGVALVAVPNMAFYHVRKRLLFGNWQREDSGAFDRTHFHFWSYHTIDEIFRDTPFRIVTKAPGNPAVPLWPLRRLLPQRALQPIDRLGGRVNPNLFAAQTLVVARREL
jgi:SAM-dependent methyltransferase